MSLPYNLKLVLQIVDPIVSSLAFDFSAISAHSVFFLNPSEHENNVLSKSSFLDLNASNFFYDSHYALTLSNCFMILSDLD